ncbi:MAG: amino acid racemase [Woeseia sp.]
MTQQTGKIEPPGAGNCRQAVGVIGGMGPAATLRFFDRVMQLTPVTTESEHLRLIIDCNPGIPDINSSLLGADTYAKDALMATASALENAGAERLVMICNAAHYYAPAIQESVSIPFDSMIDAAVQRAQALIPKGGSAGVLATDGCLRSRVFQTALEARGLDSVEPDPARAVQFMDVLGRLRSGEAPANCSGPLNSIVNAMVADGAQCIIVGCTEAQDAMEQLDVAIPIIDPVHEIAAAMVAVAWYGA